MRRFLIRFVLIAIFVLVLALVAFRFAASLRESQSSEAILTSQAYWIGGSAPSDMYIETDQTRFFALSSGPKDATPVLLAHGTAAWSGFWAREVDALAEAGYRAIAFDMPPFGYSSRPDDGDYSRRAQADRILALAKAQGQRPVMVAHSFGAAAATEAVLRDPAAFAGLIIVDGAIGMGTTPSASLPAPLRPRVLREAALSATATNPLATKFLLKQLIHRKDAATADLVNILQQPQRRTGTTAAYGDWLPSLLAPSPDGLTFDPANYADLPIPVRIIWGDRDTVTPPDQAEVLAAAIDQGPVHYIQEVGHIPHIEAPEAFIALLTKLLAEIAAP